ncbi:uncharacterized protein [Manis javanica]|uniref:uncharacterized protein n=1 Tax=Manis javanica TaxID=9974 RepID=UPI003C6D4C6C
MDGTLNNEHEQGQINSSSVPFLQFSHLLLFHRDAAPRGEGGIAAPVFRRCGAGQRPEGRGPLAADAAHARPAGQRRPPCFFPEVRGQQQHRKLSACARSPERFVRRRQGLPPLTPPALAKAQAPSNSDRPRPPPAGSRGLPRQGPAPSSSRRPVLLAAAAHPKAKGLRRRFLPPNRSCQPRSPSPAWRRQPVPPADTRPGRLPPPPPSNAFFPLKLTFAAFANAH